MAAHLDLPLAMLGSPFAPAAQSVAPASTSTATPAPVPATGHPLSPAQATSVFGHFADSPSTGGVSQAVSQPGLLDRAWHGLTDWHFEDRARRNGPAPAQSELDAPGSKWQELPQNMSVFHDNHVGKPERKYVSPDGRESVKDGDTGQEVTDPRYQATYNYVNPMQWKDAHGVGGVAEFVGRNAGHIAADVVPYLLGGNVRGPG